MTRSNGGHGRIMPAWPAALLALATACAPAEDAVPVPAEPAGERLAAARYDAEPEDSLIFERTMSWARSARLDTLAHGVAIAQLARRFVGAPYTPYTLDPDGDERLIINLREFDCVTLIENVLAFARLVRSGEDDFAAFRRELERIRYRDGVLESYVSRLHYFSEWIADNERRGLLRDITREIGGVRDDEPIDFMTRHPQSYRQLADPAVVAAIRDVERRISARPRYVIPQQRIADFAPAIRDGDIIAATSSIAGLDVAHTGFAVWQDGQLHLLHAPLVGTVVEISERPLAERIRRISGQDGIIVARPL
jgi:hypothetical protein